MTYGNIANTMQKEFNSDARQLRTPQGLDTLTFMKFMDEKEVTSPYIGLIRIVEHINIPTPQCQREFRSDPLKTRYLHAATKGLPWAKTSVSHSTKIKYTLNMFVTALRESLQIEQEFASPQDNDPTHITSAPAELPAIPAYYHLYGRDPKQFKPSPNSRGSSARESNPQGNPARTFTPSKAYAPGRSRSGNAEAITFDECQRRNICITCRAPWKAVHRCYPGSVRENYRQLIGNGESDVHLVSNHFQAIELETHTNPDPVSDLTDHNVRFTDQDQNTSENDLYMFDNRIRYVEHVSELYQHVNYVHYGTEDEGQ